MPQQFKLACVSAKTNQRSPFLHLNFPKSINCIRDRKTHKSDCTDSHDDLSLSCLQKNNKVPLHATTITDLLATFLLDFMD